MSYLKEGGIPAEKEKKKKILLEKKEVHLRSTGGKTSPPYAIKERETTKEKESELTILPAGHKVGDSVVPGLTSLGAWKRTISKEGREKS